MAASVCPDCGSHVALSLVACPGCGRLVHADKLKQLAEFAEAATRAGDLPTALTTWREAMELLPPGSRQFAMIREKTVSLSNTIDATPPGTFKTFERPPGDASDGGSPTSPAATPQQGGSAAGKPPSKTLGAMLVAAVMFLLSKGKLLLLGLTKAGTFFSMLASMSLYWAAFGWKFAVGLVVSIYIHEMGHVAMLRRFGVKASAPMFIPGVGAVVRLRQHLSTPSEDARVGLAGPIWGLGAAVGAHAVSLIMGWPSWAAIAHVGAWLNLFNLMPIWQLDGSRAFNALSRHQRLIAVLIIAMAWGYTLDGILLIIGIVAVARALSAGAPTRSDRRALIEYAVLVIVLSAMLKIPVSVESPV